MYKRHRFPPEIFQYAVWLYHRFSLSHRNVEDLLAERGITVSYESIRLDVCRLYCLRSSSRVKSRNSLPKANDSFGPLCALRGIVFLSIE